MRIAVPEPIHLDALDLLRSRAEVLDWTDPDVMDLENCEGLIVRTARVDRAMMERSSLKVIGSHGVGVDNIDLVAARELGIEVVNVPLGTANAVAELFFSLVLAVARRLVPGMDAIRTGRGVRTAPGQRGLELGGKTLGIVGYGHIGRRVSEIARLGFGMEVHALSQSLGQGETHEGVAHVHRNVSGLLAASDVVCICVPLTEQTRGLIGRAEIAWMRPRAILVNIARGGVVDEDALYHALKEDRLFGAASDVFVQEPPDDRNPLLSCPNFVATQHIGINTDECLSRIGCTVAGDVLDVLEGREPMNRVQI